MRFEVVFLAIVISLFFEISYFFFLRYIQRVKFKKNLKITNTFLFEVTPKFNEKTSFINYALLFGVIVCLFPFIYYLRYSLQVYSVTIMIIAILLMVALAVIPFLSIDKLREHLFFDVMALVLVTGLCAMEAYYAFNLYRLYTDDYQLAAMIVALVLFVLSFIMIVNPKLFDLKNNIDEEGNPSRKKIIWLAFTEWIIYPLSILSLVPLLLLCVQ